MNPYKYLPHRAPILLITEILKHQENSILCEVDCEKASFFYNKEGQFIPSVIPEIIAQAGAVLYGIQNSQTGIGLLTGIKQFQIHRLPKEKGIFTVYAKVERELGSHQIIYGEVYQYKKLKKLVAQGSVSLYIKN